LVVLCCRCRRRRRRRRCCCFGLLFRAVFKWNETVGRAGGWLVSDGAVAARVGLASLSLLSVPCGPFGALACRPDANTFGCTHTQTHMLRKTPTGRWRHALGPERAPASRPPVFASIQQTLTKRLSRVRRRVVMSCKRCYCSWPAWRQRQRQREHDRENVIRQQQSGRRQK
jgi:hypothetical protein